MFLKQETVLMKRKEKFLSGVFFHVFNKSIAGYPIFKDLSNSQRFYQTLIYYNHPNNTIKFGIFLKKNKDYSPDFFVINDENIIKIVSYCIMPDHYHLLIKIIKERSFSRYIGMVENSFSHYFNIKFNRKGPLWQSRFLAVRIKSDEQLLHVSRYIHLNPTTANLVNRPEDWIFSSYREIITNSSLLKKTLKEISISTTNSYKKFVENRIDYQKKLKLIKKCIFK